MRVWPTQVPIGAKPPCHVDPTGRRKRPAYWHRIKPILWLNLGGIVWVFVWFRISIFLILFGVSAGFNEPPFKGSAYELPPQRLGKEQIELIRQTRPVVDSNGLTVLDPRDEPILVLRLDAKGKSETLYSSPSFNLGEPATLILCVDKNATYQTVVDLLDLLVVFPWHDRVWFTGPICGPVPSSQGSNLTVRPVGGVRCSYK